MQIINEIKMEKILDIKNNTDLKTTQNNQQYLIINQLDIISLIEDIIDSIYDGRSYSQGLVYIENSNSYPLKAEKTAGHGCKYFSHTSYQFEEILADYLAIKLIDPQNELFILLKEILGIEFVSFLEQRCNEITCGEILKTDISKNNFN